MNEARTNPRAMAKQNGQQVVQVSDLGDGIGFAGFELRAVGVAPQPCDCSDFLHIPDRADCPANAPPMLAAGLFAVGGKHSPLSLNVELRAVLLGEIGRIPLANLKRLLSEEAPKAADEPAA